MFADSYPSDSDLIYHTFPPHSDLEALIKCYWTLEVPAADDHQRQRIVPDGCIEMAFILGDDIKRYTTENEYILQPRAMVLGQTIEPFFIEPAGYVNTFAIRFYPYGFANFISIPVSKLANTETALSKLFGEVAANILEADIIHAANTHERMSVVEKFLVNQLNNKVTIDNIVRTTIDALLSTKGNAPIGQILNNETATRRNLERKFRKQIGISAKQLGKVIRLQAALKMMLNKHPGNLTDIAYESEYYDQAHFIRDFKEFTGTTPTSFLDDHSMALSALFYKKD